MMGRWIGWCLILGKNTIRPGNGLACLFRRKMCGIGLYFLKNGKNLSHEEGNNECLNESNLKFRIEYENCKDWLRRRGPNVQNEFLVPVNELLTLSFYGAVLHIQGDQCTPQPFIDSQGNVLLWNGEVFGGLDYDHNISDTNAVSHAFRGAIQHRNSPVSICEAITSVLSNIQGPYAYIYYSSAEQLLVFGRDPFGRRSLILRKDNEEVCSITNVSFPLCEGNTSEWEELPIGGAYYMLPAIDRKDIKFHPWPASQLQLPRATVTPTLLSNVPSLTDSVNQFGSILQSVLIRRLSKFTDFQSTLDPRAMITPNSPSKIGVLFSGGIDSLLLAASLHLALLSSASLRHESIDLLNVAFIDEEHSLTLAPDRLSGILAFLELRRLFPERDWKFVHVDVLATERFQYENHIKQLITPLSTHMDLNIGTAFWFASRGKGYLLSYDCINEESLYQSTNQNGRPLVRIGEEGEAASKGRSSVPMEEDETTMIVSKEKVPCVNPKCNSKAPKFGCPRNFCQRCCDKANKEELYQKVDDKASLKRVEIVNSCPAHCDGGKKKKSNQTSSNERNDEKEKDQFIQKAEGTIAVADEESAEAISIPSALLSIDEERIPYQSQCKVLLVGLGADEQLAGYGRHRTVYQHGGNEALCSELNKDLKRLWQRNLGR
jgi:asparagine synthetase B (glutamine-hydrolysing)